MLIIFYGPAVNIGFSEDKIEEKNILVLHSYHHGLEWTDSISEGILSVFSERNDINIVIDYLDTKRFQSEEYMRTVLTLYEIKSEKLKFDLIISSDNAAFNFLQKNSKSYFPGVPVVFCGVNNFTPQQLDEHPLFFGFGEYADHTGTIEAIRKIFPERKNVLIINDETLTGSAIMAELEPVLEKIEDDLSFEIYSRFTIGSLLKRVKLLDDSYVIYLLVVNKDELGNFISYKRGMSLIHSVSNVPVFGSWDFYLDKGLFGGSITRGYQQGQEAAKLALRIVDDGITDTLPKYSRIDNAYIFDYKEIDKYNISVNDLPENSEIINTPKKLDIVIRIIVFISIGLLVAVVFLFIRLMIRKRTELFLQGQVKEKTKDLVETNAKLEDVISKKDKFFSILAHDLRNSIGTLVNGAKLLGDSRLSLKEADEQNLKKTLLVSAVNTSSLLEDLLYWGKNQFNEKPEISVTDFNLSKAVKEVVQTLSVNEGNIEIKCELKDDLRLRNDLYITKFILRNIIQNAVKFSRPGGKILVNCYPAHEAVMVCVKDEGIGMSKEVIESIYDKKPILQEGLFDKKNTGFGLPTVIDYLDLIEGSIVIDSVENQGTAITITLRNI